MRPCAGTQYQCRRKEADDAYALGIARRAEPLEHLESRYADFQKRMMSNAPRPEPARELPAPTRAAAPRRALATTASSLPASSSRLAAPSVAPPVPASSSNNARLQIFVDPTGEAGEAADGGTWGELGTRKARVKENAPEVKKLVGTTLRQAGRSKRVAGAASGSGSGGARIVPFRDPAPGQGPGAGDAGPGAPAPRGEKAKAKSSVAKEKMEAPPAQAPAKTFLPFVDEAPPAPPGATGPVPSFTPFRDEVSRRGAS